MNVQWLDPLRSSGCQTSQSSQNGPFWPILRVVEAVKRLDPLRYDTVLHPHTLMWMSRSEIQLNPVKKRSTMCQTSHSSQTWKWAIFAHFEGHRGCNKAGSNEIWPDITSPHPNVNVQWWDLLRSSPKNGLLGVKQARVAKIGQNGPFWPVLRAVDCRGCKRAGSNEIRHCNTFPNPNKYTWSLPRPRKVDYYWPI